MQHKSFLIKCHITHEIHLFLTWTNNIQRDLRFFTTFHDLSHPESSDVCLYLAYDALSVVSFIYTIIIVNNTLIIIYINVNNVLLCNRN